MTRADRRRLEKENKKLEQYQKSGYDVEDNTILVTSIKGYERLTEKQKSGPIEFIWLGEKEYQKFMDKYGEELYGKNPKEPLIK